MKFKQIKIMIFISIITITGVSAIPVKVQAYGNPSYETADLANQMNNIDHQYDELVPEESYSKLCVQFAETGKNQTIKQSPQQEVYTNDTSASAVVETTQIEKKQDELSALELEDSQEIAVDEQADHQETAIEAPEDTQEVTVEELEESQQDNKERVEPAEPVTEKPTTEESVTPEPAIETATIETSIIGVPNTNPEYINQALGGKLAGKGQVFVDAGIMYNIDPMFLASIAIHETGNGTSDAIESKNNVGGIMCTNEDGSTTLKTFASVDESIYALAELMSKYVSNGLDTIGEIQPVYCPIGAENDPTGLNHSWQNSVLEIWNDMRATV